MNYVRLVAIVVTAVAVVLALVLTAAKKRTKRHSK